MAARMFRSYMDHDEREAKVMDIAAQVSGAAKGSQFSYRGLTVEKVTSQKRSGMVVTVYGRCGNVMIEQLNLRSTPVHRTVEKLDRVIAEGMSQ